MGRDRDSAPSFIYWGHKTFEWGDDLGKEDLGKEKPRTLGRETDEEIETRGRMVGCRGTPVGVGTGEGTPSLEMLSHDRDPNVSLYIVLRIGLDLHLSEKLGEVGEEGLTGNTRGCRRFCIWCGDETSLSTGSVSPGPVSVTGDRRAQGSVGGTRGVQVGVTGNDESGRKTYFVGDSRGPSGTHRKSSLLQVVDDFVVVGEWAEKGGVGRHEYND